jgi:hypothetical protein
MFWILVPLAIFDLRILLVIGLVIAFLFARSVSAEIRESLRARRLRWFAREHDYRFQAVASPVTDRWPGHARLSAGRRTFAVNMVEGTRNGQPFAVFDQGIEADIEHPGFGYIDVRRFQARSYASAVVVECATPPGVRTARLKHAFAPWHLDVDATSTVAWNDRLASPAESGAVLDKLITALDAVSAAPPATA